MARYGLGNFVYDIEVREGKAVFNFHDPEDPENYAVVEVAKSEFPEGIAQADSRQVADLAYASCSKVLNDKRDKRLAKESAAAVKAQQKEDARQREEANDFLNNSNELANTEETGSQPEPVEDVPAPPHEDKSVDSVEGTEEDQAAAKKASKGKKED